MDVRLSLVPVGRLSTNSEVDRNAATVQGGGIFGDSGVTVTIEAGSSIDHNSATNEGGGIYSLGGTLNGATAGPGGNVYDNTPDNIYP